MPALPAMLTHRRKQLTEPLVPTPPLQYPFQHTVVDLFQLEGQMYLAYADRLTGWLELAQFPIWATLSRLPSVFCQYFQR